MRPGARGKNRSGSYNTFLVIICFSVGLLGGYLILGGPRTVDSIGGKHEGELTLTRDSKAWTSRRELFTPTGAGSHVQAAAGAAAGGTTGALPQNVALGNTPPAKGEVSKEMAAALKQQQSDKSEHAVAAHDTEHKEKLDMMKAQQSDKSEHKAAAGASGGRAEQAKTAVTGGGAAKAADAAAAGTAKAADTTTAAGTAKPAVVAATTATTTAANTTATTAATTAATTTAAATTAATTTAAATPAPAVSAASATPAAAAAATKPAFKGVFPDANTWPITPVKQKMPGNTIHTLFTSNGSPYQNIQARIMVGTYEIVRKMPGGERLVAMTRILHRTTPDEVMDEIPTFIAQPLQPECDKWCWFPVADRANAMQQFIDAAEKDPTLLKAPWLLLLETDYVWMKPLPDPGDAYDRNVPGWSFGFDYIATHIPIIQTLLKERCPDCDAKNVPNSGPAPVMARFSDFKAATPIWEELSKWIETHEDAKKLLGWVREMYAWDIGVAANKLNIRNLGPPASPLISQPPHDRVLGNASMYHYTWGTLYLHRGEKKEFWMFDKRSYTAYEHQLKLPAIPMPPEWADNIVLQDGLAVSAELHGTVVDMLKRMNEAIAVLPDLTEKVKAQKAAEAAKAVAAKT